MAAPNCKTCGSIDPSIFYKSINTYCKEHWKEKVRNNRLSRKDQYRAYERSRAHLPHRVESRNYSGNGKIGLYCVIPEGHPSRDECSNAMAYVKRQPKDCDKRPNLYKAHLLTHNALRNKILIPEGCVNCGSIKKICAHHPDYLKPLTVEWMCVACHNKWHRDNGEGLNP